MAIAFRAATSTIQSTIAKPAGVVQGDLLILVGFAYGMTWLAPPASGFQELTFEQTATYWQGAGGPSRWQGWYKLAGASEPSDYAVHDGTTAEADVVWVMAAYSGAHNLAPLDSYLALLANSPSSVIALPNMTPTATDDRFVSFAVALKLGTTPTFSWPIGLTERKTHTRDGLGSGGGFSVRVGVADRQLTGLERSGGGNITLNGSSVGGYITVLARTANRAPTAVTGLKIGPSDLMVGDGGSTDLSGEVQVYAKFNDPDGNIDAISGAAVRRNTGGAYVYWNGTEWSAGSEFFVPTTSETMTFPAGAWVNGGAAYNLSKRYRDKAGLAGAWTTDIQVTGSARPSVTIGTIDPESSRPSVPGVYADPEGAVMAAAQLAVFDADQAPDGFDPETATAVWRSFVLTASSLGYEEDTGAFAIPVQVSLPNGDYVVAMRVYQFGLLASEWDTKAHTVAVEPLATPLLRAVFDDHVNAVRLTANPVRNLLTPKQSDLRHGIEDWRSGNSNTSQPVGIEGTGMQITALGPDEMAVDLELDLDIAPDSPYSIAWQQALADGDVPGTGRFEIIHFDTLGNQLEPIRTPSFAELPLDTGTGPPPPPPPPPTGFAMVYDASSAYASPKTLQDALIEEGPMAALFVRLDVTGTPAQEITRVEWYHRASGAGSWTLYRTTDTVAPYNMEGNDSGVSFDLFPTDGAYEVRALIIYADATSEEFIASWNMKHQVTSAPYVPTYRIDVASSGDPFPNARPLTGATLSAPSWIHLGWSPTSDDPAISNVDWYWRPGTAGTWIPVRIGTDVGPPFEFSSSPPTDPSFFGDSGTYQVRAVVNHTAAGVPDPELISTFSTLVSETGTGIVVAGDYGSPGAEKFTDPRVLAQWTGSWTSDPLRNITGKAREGSSGSSNVRVQRVSGKSWTTELWSYNPGTGVLKGFEQRLDLGDLGLPTNLEEGAFRYAVMWPSKFRSLGDMKMPGFAGFKTTNASLSSIYGNWAQEEERDDTWGASHMSGYRDNLGLKHYLGVPRVGTGSYRSPDHNYWNIVPGVDRPITQGVWWEIAIYVKLNTTYGASGGDNGIYSLYLTRLPATTRTRVSHLTNVQYRKSSSSDIKFVNLRSFWGGGGIELPTSAITYETSPRFRDFAFATALAALPIARAA